MNGGRFNFFYVLIALLFVGMLYISSRYFKGSARSSIGITYSKEYKISTEKSATIKSVRVMPGQEVKTGDLLVELISNELEIDIDKLQYRIGTLRTEQTEKAKLINSEIAYLKAQYNITIEGIDSDEAQIKSEMKLNEKLTTEFEAAASPKIEDHSQDPLQLKLASLNQRKAMHLQAFNIKIQDLFQENKTEQNALGNQIKLLERELKLLTEEKRKLNKFASFDGVVENVFVKSGEEVDAFYALLSINPKHPTTVVGYYVGKKESNVPIGAEVTVSSYDHRSVITVGTVIGFGSVVELPEILQKSTAVKAFGRELFIEITPDNRFATGEKVLIR